MEYGMKEIKAFLRPERMDSVVHALDDAGFHAMTVIPVQAIGTLADPQRWHLATLLMKRFSSVYKLELICHDRDVDRALRLIRELGRSGQPGDGAVFVSSIERAVKIRTGEEGVDAIEG
jgi:nitrogen regulatory protein P-II 1